MFYQFVLKKQSPNTTDTITYLKRIMNDVLILKVETVPEQNMIQSRYRDLILGLKETIRQMYKSTNFVTVPVVQNIQVALNNRRILLKASVQGIRKLESVQIINGLHSVDLPYIENCKQPMTLEELIIQDQNYSYFNNNKLKCLFANQVTTWTYLDKQIIVNIQFTYNSHNRVALLLCFQYQNIQVDFYSKSKDIHMVIIPTRQPWFYCSQASFQSYIHPLLRKHHHFDNIFYPPSAKDNIYLRLVINKSTFESKQYISFYNHLKLQNLFTYKSIAKVFKPRKQFDYQFYYEKIKKQTQRSLMESYILSSEGPQYDLEFENIYNSECKLGMLISIYSQNLISNVQSNLHYMHINFNGQIVVQNKKHKIVGTTEAGHLKGRIFVVQDKIWEKLNISWNSRERAKIDTMQKVMPLGNIECHYIEEIADQQLKVQNNFQRDKDDVFFFGWMGNKNLRKHHVYFQNVVVYVKIQNIKGYIFCQESSQNPTRDSTDTSPYIDLYIFNIFKIQEDEVKLKLIGIQQRHQHFLTDKQSEFFLKIVPYSDLINIQKQTYQLLLYYLECYFHDSSVHPLLNLIAPVSILRMLNPTYYFKQQMVNKFQQIKKHLPLGIKIQAIYGTTSRTLSSLKGHFIFIIHRDKVIKIKNQFEQIQNNYTNFVVLPKGFRSIFHGQKFILITNEFVNNILTLKSVMIPDITDLLEYSYLPYTYSYSHFVKQTLDSTTFHSLFTYRLKLRAPYLKKQTQQSSHDNQSTSFIEKVCKLVEQAIRISRCDSYVRLIIDGENVEDLYRLGSMYVDAIDIADEDIQTIRNDVTRIKNVKYREIHELFLSSN